MADGVSRREVDTMVQVHYDCRIVDLQFGILEWRSFEVFVVVCVVSVVGCRVLLIDAAEGKFTSVL